jgi:hypothetical protein
MKNEFVPYNLAIQLKELGFDEPCFGWWFADEEMLIIDKSTKSTSENIIQAPLYQQAFRWFREKYDLHVHIRKEDYVYKNIHNNYFHFDISKGEQTDITKQEDLYSNLMDECEQNIPGNYLDNEKLNILIFEKGFAFKIYEEAELACLNKLIDIVKNGK